MEKNTEVNAEIQAMAGGKEDPAEAVNQALLSEATIFRTAMGSRPGGIVLDPFAGSGSTLIAAQTLDRRFIGIEREQEYFEIAAKRMSHHAANQIRNNRRTTK